MALKEYEFEGRTFQFEDNDVPKGAKLVESKTETKQAKPANKQVKPANK